MHLVYVVKSESWRKCSWKYHLWLLFRSMWCHKKCLTLEAYCIVRFLPFVYPCQRFRCVNLKESCCSSLSGPPLKYKIKKSTKTLYFFAWRLLLLPSTHSYSFFPMSKGMLLHEMVYINFWLISSIFLDDNEQIVVYSLTSEKTCCLKCWLLWK